MRHPGEAGTQSSSSWAGRRGQRQTEEEDGEGEHKRKTRDQETENWPWNCWALQAPKPGRKVAVK